MKVLGLCFLIYDKINHEELWYNWLKNVDNNKYKIYIHYKTNRKLKYFEKYKLNNCIETKYADISLVKAQNLLINASINNNCSHTIFLSGACIPFKNFEYIYNKLDVNYSYFNKSPDRQCFPRCNKTITFINKDLIKKSSQWCILNNKHAKILISESDYLDWFDYKETVPDEHCYITLIYYLNLQDEIIATPNTCYSGATTFTAWSDMIDYKRYNDSIKTNSLTYLHICKQEIDDLVNGKCLFGRKFNENCNVIKNNNEENIGLSQYLSEIIC